MSKFLIRFFSSNRHFGEIEKKIIDKIEANFGDSVHKEVLNTSWKHSRGSETHFEVHLVSDKFENKSILEKNRMLNEILKEEIKMIHSISYRLLPLSKWTVKDRDNLNIKNPPCVNFKANKQLY
ncbi:unnamed protein product [Brachionus calyciflorus]|uniref:BolA n=1 Tax=Brachionus calyciflorus TaxID=104777 RepID=A0A814BRS9_9BILA|nr:unnamed protein product [Brachionus calyciflorus]